MQFIQYWDFSDLSVLPTLLMSDCRRGTLKRTSMRRRRRRQQAARLACVEMPLGAPRRERRIADRHRIAQISRRCTRPPNSSSSYSRAPLRSTSGGGSPIKATCATDVAKPWLEINSTQTAIFTYLCGSLATLSSPHALVLSRRFETSESLRISCCRRVVVYLLYVHSIARKSASLSPARAYSYF